MPAPIALDVYSSRESLLNKKNKFSTEVSWSKESDRPVYLSAPADDKYV
jgi:hypothetical protein